MKKIGLIGGMSEESSLEYQRIILEMVREKYGPRTSPWWTIEATNFDVIVDYMEKGRWYKVEKEIIQMLMNLIKTDCKVIALCTNTMHRFAKQILQVTKEKNSRDVLLLEDASQHIPVKFIDIREAVAQSILEDGPCNPVGLIGTIPTMSSGLYQEVCDRRGIYIKTPRDDDQRTIHEAIFERLIQGHFEEKDRIVFEEIIRELNCERVILGCTEIPKLLKGGMSGIKFYDTTLIHCKAIVAEISK